MINSRCLLAGWTIAVALAAAPSVSGQSINFVVNHTTGAGSLQPPPNAFNAAGQNGFWSRHIGNYIAGTQIPINDLAGNPTPIRLAMNSNTSTINATSNGSLGSSTVEVQSILAGVWSFTGSRTLTFTNLWNGNYDVYVYAMSPSTSSNRTDVTLNGTQQVGGLYHTANIYEQLLTHSLHQHAQVTNGTLTIQAQTAAGSGSIAAIQLRMTTEPTGACCLGSHCVITQQANCVAAGGVFQGPGVACASANCPPVCTADIAPPGGDGAVNVNDLLQIINSWGPCQ